MKRVFFFLAVISTGCFAAAATLGLNVGDILSQDSQVQTGIGTHMLTGMGAIICSMFVHTVSLIYFQATGRWVAEVSRAYSLEETFVTDSQRLKRSLVPALIVCLTLLLLTGLLGGLADSATPLSLEEQTGIRGSLLHFFAAITTIVVNLMTYITEFVAISHHTAVVDSVLSEVSRIRKEHGLSN